MCAFTLVHTEKDINKIDTKMLTLAVEKGIVKILVNFIAFLFFCLPLFLEWGKGKEGIIQVNLFANKKKDVIFEGKHGEKKFGPNIIQLGKQVAYASW